MIPQPRTLLDPTGEPRTTLLLFVDDAQVSASDVLNPREDLEFTVMTPIAGG